MKTLVTNLSKSFKIGEGGYSGRKLSAFFSIALSGFLSYQFTTEHNLSTILSIWLLFALLCLGIVTIEQVIKLKHDHLKEEK